MRGSPFPWLRRVLIGGAKVIEVGRSIEVAIEVAIEEWVRMKSCC